MSTASLYTAKLCTVWLVAATAAMGQSYDFDNSANATLHGQYFVREVVLRNLSVQGSVGNAIGAIGIATFDGAGTYSFNGQLTATGGVPLPGTSTGTYAVASNGFLRIASFASRGATAFGGVGAVGPSAFTASATENSSPVFDLIVGVPMGSNVSIASLKGAYNGVYLNFPQADAGRARQASMPLTADGAGGFGTVTATGSATDNPTLTTQTIPGVTYSLAGTSGTINFGTANSNQFIGGTASFFVSADGALLVGGSPGGYDLLLASRADSSVVAGSFQGFYFMGGLEADNTAWTGGAGTSRTDAYYGSVNSTGQGTYLSHLRLNSNGFSTEDLTSAWSSAIQSNGNFTPGDGDQYRIGSGGTVLLGIGQGNFYSIAVGLQAAKYLPPVSTTAVFLNPLGIVNAASFAPATNPVAPYEMVTLFGTNLSAITIRASFPLPNSLGGTRVLVNGIAAPLVAVSPNQVTILMPGHTSPDFTAYAAFEVQNNAVTSNLVTMFTNYTSPGVFSLSGNGIGPAAAEVGAGYGVIGPSNPARPGNIAILFATGMGSVTPPLADGVSSSPTGDPLNMLNIYNDSSMSLYFDGYSSRNIQFAGVVPGYAAGLDQINAQIPTGVSNGNDYVDVLTPDGEAEQVTVNLLGGAGPVGAKAIPARVGNRKRSVRTVRAIRPPATHPR